MSTQASNFVGSIPEHYDRFLGPRLFHSFADDLAQRVAVRRPENVLELAAGTGIVTRRLRDLLPEDCPVVATDLNSPMLDVARLKFRSTENVSFEAADATRLPYGETTFDAVLCQFGVMFFPDKQRSFEEVFRVLKPGGRYVFNVWGPWAGNPFAAVAHHTVAAIFPDNPPGFYRVPFSYSDATVIEQAVQDAGFSRVAIETLDTTSEIPSATEFASGLVFGNPLFEEITSRGGDPDSVCASMATALESELGQTLSLQALVVEASKAPGN